jgi:hypothetical protein
MKRKGQAKGKGKGYKNLPNFPKDPKIHSDSGKGRKQPQRIPKIVTQTPSSKKTYKSIKCSYIKCPYEAEGYYSTSRSGLWCCKNHSYGTLTTKVSDIKSNPKHPSRWQLRENFRNGKFISERELEKEFEKAKLQGKIITIN